MSSLNSRPRMSIAILMFANLLWASESAAQVRAREIGISLPLVDWAAEAAILPEQGPRMSFDLPDVRYSLGFVARDWPIAIQYELEEKGFLMLRIKIENSKHDFFLKGRPEKKQLEKLKVPHDFPKQAVPAQFIVAAFEKNKARGEQIGVKLHGIGVGKRAVSSLTLKDLKFGPGPIRIAFKGKADYSFFPKEDFDRTHVEFFHQRLDAEGNLVTTMVRSDSIDYPRKKKYSDSWYGLDADGKPSGGLHMMQVRAWFSGPKNKKEWTVVSSDERVKVLLE